MNARRFPRTTDEAFGPYNRSSQCHIVPMPDAPMHPAEALVLRASVVAGIAVLIVLVIERFA